MINDSKFFYDYKLAPLYRKVKCDKVLFTL